MSASSRAWVFFPLVSSCASSASTPSYPFLPRARPATIRLSATDKAPRAPRRFRRRASASARPRRRGTPPMCGPSFPQARLQDLLAMEPGELQVLGRRLHERVKRHEADDLALRDLDAFLRGQHTDRFECLDK